MIKVTFLGWGFWGTQQLWNPYFSTLLHWNQLFLYHSQLLHGVSAYRNLVRTLAILAIAFEAVDLLTVPEFLLWDRSGSRILMEWLVKLWKHGKSFGHGSRGVSYECKLMQIIRTKHSFVHTCWGRYADTVSTGKGRLVWPAASFSGRFGGPPWSAL